MGNHSGKKMRCLLLLCLFTGIVLCMAGFAAAMARQAEEPASETVLSRVSANKEAASETAAQEAAVRPYTFVWMSDTQMYSESAPEIYNAMTTWIADHVKEENLKFVFHTGDVVNDSSQEEQWKNADQAMKVLDGIIPYSILAGNHDLTDTDHPYEKYLEYFGQERFGAVQGNVWYYNGGEASARILDTGNTRYLILSLGYDPDGEAAAWANRILIAHAGMPAILTTHNYLNVDGTRSETGNWIFDEIVQKNPDVRLVLCGHNHSAARRTDAVDDDGNGKADRTVYQLLADYQETPGGGNGFLRLLTIDERAGTLSVATYSPYLDRYNCFDSVEDPEKDQFFLDISDWFQ